MDIREYKVYILRYGDGLKETFMNTKDLTDYCKTLSKKQIKYIEVQTRAKIINPTSS
jgi:hypothetical protein